MNHSQVRSLTELLKNLVSDPSTQCTTPMMPQGQRSPLHCRRFVYGYALDGSDFPCYFLWPRRTREGHFWLLDPQSQQYFAVSVASFLRPLGVQYFYDAFGLKAELSIRPVAIQAFQLLESELPGDLYVSHLRRRWRGG